MNRKKFIQTVGILLYMLLLGISAAGGNIKKADSAEVESAEEVNDNNIITKDINAENTDDFDIHALRSGIFAAMESTTFSEEDLANLEYAKKVGIDWMTQKNPEDDVYSFLQGPRAYNTGLAWGGEWCNYSIRGNSFGGFGCGLCCMANIYDTMTEYEVDPLEMFEYAKVASKYSPTSKTGAIGWLDIWRTMKKCGFDVRVHSKPETYEEFQQDMVDSTSMIALVSSRNSDEYWTHTAGHYINIYLYDEDDDTVFLAEPGNPENNRTRIPLRYVYDALKTASNYQYLMAVSYDENKNKWKGDGISAAWNRPE